jgi:hypothetical protein
MAFINSFADVIITEAMPNSLRGRLDDFRRWAP